MKKALLFLLVIFSFNVYAQTDSTLKSRKDLFDALRPIFKSRKAIRADTLPHNPKKIYFSVLPGFGYAQQKGFSAVSTNNASFFIHKDSINKMSSVDFIAEYTQFNQFLFPVLSTIWSRDNRYCFKGDWRYLKYSTEAYGLGGVNDDTEAELINYSHLRLYQLVLGEFATNMLGGIGYNLDYHFHIKSDPSNAGYLNKEIRAYGLDSNTVSSGISFNLLYDPRRNANYPKEGLFCNFVYRNSMTALGGNSNWSTLLIDLRKYLTFPANTRNVLAFWSYNWITLYGKQPYFDLPGNGWDMKSNVARQFRQGRYTARNMAYVETEYRFEITRNGLLAGVVFANALSVSNKTNTGFDPILPGLGAGLRLLTNKQSNTHLSLTYAMGLNGAGGFTFNLGEAF